MKHLIENNQIVMVHLSIPQVFDKDGLTSLAYDLLPDERHYADGWRDEVIPEHDPRMQHLSDPYYDAERDVVTYAVIDRTDLPTLAEAKAQKVQQIKAMAGSQLARTDWYVVRQMETGKPVPEDVLAERDAIRTRSNELEAAVTALAALRDAIVFEVGY